MVKWGIVIKVELNGGSGAGRGELCDAIDD
jgi:hypothetical protein